MVDASPVTLQRLLTRLDHSLTSDGSAANGLSSYERSRVGANLDYARSLLLSLERNAASIRVQSQRQPLQADLQRKRDWIKSLNARLEEYANAADEEDDDNEGDDDDEDCNNDTNDANGRRAGVREYAPARSDVNSGLDTGEISTSRIPESVANELRSRRPLQAADNRSAASTTAREQLFSARSGANTDGGSFPQLEQTEALISHNRTEQESLVGGLLNLAQALKASSIQFGASLESEKEILQRAAGGMEQSSLGMEAAERKMGTLRRMSEGQGWWGRLKLYGFIFGLWLACFLLVFLAPKLRF